MTLRPFSAIKGGILTERDRETLETALRAWKEVDHDTLDVLVNNLLENGVNERGWAFASYDVMLDARERQKKTKLEDGKRYKSGHRLEVAMRSTSPFTDLRICLRTCSLRRSNAGPQRSRCARDCDPRIGVRSGVGCGYRRMV